MDRLMFLLIQTVVLHNIACVYGASLRSDDKDDLQQTLDTDENLAYDICYDLEYYHKAYNASIPFSDEECRKNFMGPAKYTDKLPPKVFEKCQYQSKIIYGINPVEDPDLRRLIVLTRINNTEGTYPFYDLLQSNSEELSTIEISSGKYQTWSTLISIDGSHSPWLRGPSVRSWNLTGEVKNRSYRIQVATQHQPVNESSAVTALVSWEPFDDEDKCFDFVSFCGSKKEVTIWPNESTSVEMQGLSMGEDCEIQLMGKYGLTRYSYSTPDCGNLPACIEYEKAHNISLTAVPGSRGWDVYVSWSYLTQPLFYNITFASKHVARSIQLPGNKTEVVFEDVDDSGKYNIAFGSVFKGRTIYTISSDVFPVQVAGWRVLGPALGGTWGALVGAGVLTAAVVLLWRRRRANKLKHIFFLEPLDKPCKETGEAADAEVATTDDAWELKSERLLLHEVIGEGAFGVVRRGTLAPAGKEVAVKMLKDFPTLDEIRSFRAEMELMKSVGAHPHVVSLVGCCSGRRPLIVAEYCSRGDLLSYLRCSWDVMISKRNAKYYNNNVENTDYRNDLFKCQVQGEHSKLVVNKLYDLQGICDTELTTRDLLSFCRQIAMGMEFLSSNRLVHRDLAARNVLVSSDRTLKIADFGLSRDVYEENLYKQKGNGKMPMKWMAPESLTRRIYTSQSDVWSFGVVMWEVVSVGASPYPGVPPARLPRLLRAGYRMPRPHNCSKHLYEVMLSCWRAHPRERPTFSQLHAHLDELLNSACEHDYLSLEPDADDAPPHFSPQKYVKMYLKDKLGWSRGEPYERPLRTAQSNHYSTPPASAYKLQTGT